MKGFTRTLAYIAALGVAVVLTACSDPTSGGIGKPTYIDPNCTRCNVRVNGTVTVTAFVRDDERNSLPDASSMSAVLSSSTLLHQDSTHYVIELSQQQFFLKAGASTKLDSAKVTLTSGSLSKDVWVIVNP